MSDQESRFTRSRSNARVERSAYTLVLQDPRFQKPTREVKSAILDRLGAYGEWTQNTFDLVMTDEPAPELSLENLGDWIDRLALVEVKSTKKAIQDTRLNGFFFGTTQRQYQLAYAVPDHYRYAFVVLNDDNAYGRPFFALLTVQDVQRRTRSRRLQYQVSFRTDITAEEDGTPGPLPG